MSVIEIFWTVCTVSKADKLPFTSGVPASEALSVLRAMASRLELGSSLNCRALVGNPGVGDHSQLDLPNFPDLSFHFNDLSSLGSTLPVWSNMDTSVAGRNVVPNATPNVVPIPTNDATGHRAPAAPTSAKKASAPANTAAQPAANNPCFPNQYKHMAMEKGKFGWEQEKHVNKRQAALEQLIDKELAAEKWLVEGRLVTEAAALMRAINGVSSSNSRKRKNISTIDSANKRSVHQLADDVSQRANLIDPPSIRHSVNLSEFSLDHHQSRTSEDKTRQKIQTYLNLTRESNRTCSIGSPYLLQITIVTYSFYVLKEKTSNDYIQCNFLI
ncbi:hypothetical protein PSHT_06110 [Puccinia striiformis]|uniref:Uncharacterized protein n=1 Tax=Puccinia striiformis TaxID=27350 RepID=A0A2S4W8R1_9BASI|nr:hypothetical protein PSHT_06110 [Puccinia striiformis]